MTIDNHQNLRDQLSIDYQYLIDIDCHRLSPIIDFIDCSGPVYIYRRLNFMHRHSLVWLLWSISIYYKYWGTWLCFHNLDKSDLCNSLFLNKIPCDQFSVKLKLDVRSLGCYTCQPKFSSILNPQIFSRSATQFHMIPPRSTWLKITMHVHTQQPGCPKWKPCFPENASNNQPKQDTDKWLGYKAVHFHKRPGYKGRSSPISPPRAPPSQRSWVRITQYFRSVLDDDSSYLYLSNPQIDVWSSYFYSEREVHSLSREQKCVTTVILLPSSHISRCKIVPWSLNSPSFYL